jgi:hypothetical protein
LAWDVLAKIEDEHDVEEDISGVPMPWKIALKLFSNFINAVVQSPLKPGEVLTDWQKFFSLNLSTHCKEKDAGPAFLKKIRYDIKMKIKKNLMTIEITLEKEKPEGISREAQIEILGKRMYMSMTKNVPWEGTTEEIYLEVKIYKSSGRASEVGLSTYHSQFYEGCNQVFCYDWSEIKVGA